MFLFIYDLTFMEDSEDPMKLVLLQRRFYAPVHSQEILVIDLFKCRQITFVWFWRIVNALFPLDFIKVSFGLLYEDLCLRYERLLIFTISDLDHIRCCICCVLLYPLLIPSYVLTNISSYSVYLFSKSNSS